MASTTIESLDHLYLIWLGGKVSKGSRHLELFEIMFEKEFVWLVANDDNRIEDGLDLRREFLLDVRFHTTFQIDHNLDPRSVNGLKARAPSVLEVLIGLSRRLAFMAGGIPEVWAWQLIKNLEFHPLRDPLSPRKRDGIDARLDELIFRTYNEDGTGGFFPLAFPEENQNQVELWYQMSAYIEEHQAP